MRFVQTGQASIRKHALTSIFLLLAMVCCLPAAPAAAQSGDRVTITAPDAGAFPQVSFLMEAYQDARFMEGLSAADVSVVENGKTLPVESLEVLQPGMQVVVAYNIGPLMATKAGQRNLYQNLQAGLVDWAGRQPPASADDFTLIGNEGLLTIRQSDPRRWAEELAAYQPDLQQARPGLSSLSQALDIATDPNPRANMKRAMLYITTLPGDNNLTALPNLTQRAAQVGLRVFVWLVRPANSEPGKALEALQTLADKTGGELFLYSGSETLPDPEAYFKPLRSLYRVTYRSQVTQAGSQQLAAVVQGAGSKLTSAELRFQVDVQAPNPIFLAPPAQIKRVVETRSGSESQSEPQSDRVTLKIMVEFPDGHARQLARSLLLVDGKTVVERTSAPFDVFDWDVSGYEESQTLTLQVRVEDSLGLERASIETPVDILVEKRGAALVLEKINTQRLLIGGAVAAAALVLALVMWMGGKRGWLSRERRKRNHLLKDPLTQPVAIQQDAPRSRPLGDRAGWVPPAQARKAPAWLVRLDENNQPVSGNVVPVNRREISIGSNPQQATCVVNQPSVEGLHARLYLTQDGMYMLADAGSVAGTWVNYSPVSSSGARLEHGDLVHFGRAAFRFELANPVHIRQPQVSEHSDLL